MLRLSRVDSTITILIQIEFESLQVFVIKNGCVTQSFRVVKN